MIYFDNAATTRQKPPEVARAVAAAINGFGGVGRGVHEASVDAGLAVFTARKQVADLLGGPGPARVAFGNNVTEALNIAIAGLLGQGECTVTTAASHNSVLRPLFRAADERAARVEICPIAPDGSLGYDEFSACFERAGGPVKLAVFTHASNLTGDVYDIERMARIAHEHGAIVVVDAAQTAGVVPINMIEQGLDVVCFTGHKGLYGPQGTGGLCIREGLEIPAFKEGGTGTHSYDRRQPDFMPEHLEAGTINAHGIAGLSAGLSFIETVGIDAIRAHEVALARRFEEGARALPGVHVYGGSVEQRTGIVALNIGDVDSAVVADILGADFEICVRAGAHCAPLMHEALGTDHQGAVRFSFSYFNTPEEVDTAIAALADISVALSA